MNLKEIKKLIEMVEEAKVSHVSIETEGMKIEVKKEFSISHAIQQPMPLSMPSTAPAQMPAPSADAAPAAKKDDESGLTPIKAQMVGTFYAAPNPDAQAYVKIGDRVKAGQVICIIEAMKLFNEIESEYSGVIEKICVPNAAPVEYGQTLFLIRPE